MSTFDDFGLHCPDCGRVMNSRTCRVYDTRPSVGRSQKRRRTCQCCGRRFTTREAMDPHLSHGGGEGDPADIRALGWMVALHNDYRHDGKHHTSWLFTKATVCVKGVGATDAQALNEVRRQIGLLHPQEDPCPMPPTPGHV